MARQTRFVLLLFTFFAAAGALLASSAAADLSAAARAQAMPSLHALRRVEDDASSFVESVEEAAYPPRRALYGGGFISYGTLTANQAACHGSCAAPGQSYTGRGCQPFYGCRG